jgi:hypothetical protein
MGEEADADWDAGMIEAGREYVENQIKDAFYAASRQPKRRQTALRVRGRSFESVDLDDNGKVIEPPPRCCYGGALHAPNCKYWLTCT